MTTKSVVCVNCGRTVEVSARASMTKYCPKCAKATARERNRTSCQKYLARKRLEATKQRKPQKSVAQIAEEARSAGMSYGQYVAKMEGGGAS